MKDKMKNTLEHEVELLGRSISVLAIAGLLVVGGASAALLNSFGEITGDADVEQAITVNEVDAEEDDFVQNFNFDGATEVVGETFTESNTVENNVGSSQEVYFNGAVSTPYDGSSDDYVDEGSDAYTAEHLLLENGETFTRVEDDSGDLNDEDADSSASVYYTLDGSGDVVVEAEVDHQDDSEHVSAGVQFDVEGELSSDDDATSISVTSEDLDSNQPAPDWVFMAVTTDSEYGTGDGDYDSFLLYNADSEDTWEYDQDAIVHPVDSLEDSYSDQSKEDSIDVGSEEDLEWDDLEGAEIEYVAAAAGSSSGSDVYLNNQYSSLEFNDGDDRFESFEFEGDNSVTVPEGQSEFGTVIDFELNAYPGNYEFTLGVNPEEASS